MKVQIVDREAMAEHWGKGLFSVIVRAVEVADTCPVCGGTRGVPALRRFCEDGDWYSVHVWENPCGHVDKYRDVLKEAVSS